MKSAAYVNANMPRCCWMTSNNAHHGTYGLETGRVYLLDSHSQERHNYEYTTWRLMPGRNRGEPAKIKALLEEGTLNPTPEKVHDRKFQENEFFDSRDLVQVKYEMLRRVSTDRASVTHATEEYGVSRPTYYQSKASFEKGGIAGLVPRKRGPRGPHKLLGEALQFVEQQLVAGEPVRARELAKLIRQTFGLNIHPRTIERAAAGKKTSR
ncbi:MAG TPA: helix-turn-helix domain-containing protein [Edaphobacter sp.]|nr:helix-turn-helix domain-containing protein [Edaphobacter sp.]